MDHGVVKVEILLLHADNKILNLRSDDGLRVKPKRVALLTLF
jgi:hypothetical protein